MSKIEKPKNRKQYFNKNSHKRQTLVVNLKGFLCSCNNREKDCVRESYNILNKYADILWPQESQDTSESLPKEANIEDELKRELNELKSENTSTKRFQVIDSGAKNFLFIKTTLDDPVKLAESILSDIFENKSQQTKFLLRLVPVESTSKAYIKDIETAFTPLLEKHFSTTTKTFSIVFNHRNNNSVSRDEVIKNIADIVAKYGKEKTLEHKVDLKSADVSIVIEVIRGFAFLGVVPNFYKFKKYNLLAFGNQETESSCNSDISTLEKSEEQPNIDLAENKN